MPIVGRDRERRIETPIWKRGMVSSGLVPSHRQEPRGQR